MQKQSPRRRRFKQEKKGQKVTQIESEFFQKVRLHDLVRNSSAPKKTTHF